MWTGLVRREAAAQSLAPVHGRTVNVASVEWRAND